jgi:hypothetical protein
LLFRLLLYGIGGWNTAASMASDPKDEPTVVTQPSLNSGMAINILPKSNSTTTTEDGGFYAF